MRNTAAVNRGSFPLNQKPNRGPQAAPVPTPTPGPHASLSIHSSTFGLYLPEVGLGLEGDRCPESSRNMSFQLFFTFHKGSFGFGEVKADSFLMYFQGRTLCEFLSCPYNREEMFVFHLASNYFSKRSHFSITQWLHNEVARFNTSSEAPGFLCLFGEE